jgi:hypothetical protein
MIVARMLSFLAVLLTVLAIDAFLLHFLPWGFEGTGYVALFSFVLANAAALSALVIAVVRARPGTRGGFSQVLLFSGISLLTLATLLAANLAGYE